MNNRKLWAIVFIVLMLAVFASGCTTDPNKVNLPSDAVQVGKIESASNVNPADEITVWNWCDRGTKVYFSYIIGESVALATSPGHKDCQ